MQCQTLLHLVLRDMDFIAILNYINGCVSSEFASCCFLSCRDAWVNHSELSPLRHIVPMYDQTLAMRALAFLT